MSPKSISAKMPRAYRSELRQQQAETTRSRVVEAAAELFAADGYARTTLAKIAEAAGVSAETVQGQGPKAALLIAADRICRVRRGRRREHSQSGARPRSASPSKTGEAAQDLIVAAAVDVHERTAQLALALFGGASVDPELDRYLADFIASINRNTRRVLEVCQRARVASCRRPLRRSRRDDRGDHRRRNFPADHAPRRLECGCLRGVVPAHAG